MLVAALPENGNSTSSEASCFFKKLDSGQCPPPPQKKKKIVLFNFSCTVFSLLFTHGDLAVLALVWLCLVWFRVIWIGAVSSALRT
jgi:hypothetical protein